MKVIELKIVLGGTEESFDDIEVEETKNRLLEKVRRHLNREHEAAKVLHESKVGKLKGA
jgi:hypothetical protein